MQALHVLFDETCGFCCRCAAWLRDQPKYGPMFLRPAGAATTKDAFPTLQRPGRKQEFVVIDEQGGVYRDGDAWIAVMWNLKGYRGWAKKLNEPALRPLARNVFEFISGNRHKVSEWFGLQPTNYIAQTLVERYGGPDAAKCTEDACEVPATGPICSSCWKQVSVGREFCPHCLARMVRDSAAAS